MTAQLENMLNDFCELAPQEKEYLADYVIEWATSATFYEELRTRNEDRRCS